MNIRRFYKSPYLWAFLLGIASLHLVRELSLIRRSAPEPLVYVPDWTLVDQDNQPFGKKDLMGKVVVADFFFTSCPTICPRLTNAMKEVHARFLSKLDKVHFVSITVDPTTDTPSVLKKFMKEQGIDGAGWSSLTGSKQQIYDVVVEKMRVHMGDKQLVDEKSGAYDIPHLAHLALFDQNGDLRGLWKTEPVELAALVRAINFLLE